MFFFLSMFKIRFMMKNLLGRRSRRRSVDSTGEGSFIYQNARVRNDLEKCVNTSRVISASFPPDFCRGFGSTE